MEILEPLLKNKWSFHVGRYRGFLDFGYIAAAWRDKEGKELQGYYNGKDRKSRFYFECYGETVEEACVKLLKIIEESMG